MRRTATTWCFALTFAISAMLGACQLLLDTDRLLPEKERSDGGGENDGSIVPDDASSSDATGDSSQLEASSDVADASGPAIPAGSKLIFVRVPNDRSDFLNIAQADDICTAMAPAGVSAARALLVGTARRACTTEDCQGGGANEHIDWPLLPNTEYRRDDDFEVVGVTNANGIFDEPLKNVIRPSGALLAWTGLAKGDGGTTWLTTNNCADWSSVAPGATGTMGYTYLFDGPFGYQLQTCENNQALYCVQTAP